MDVWKFAHDTGIVDSSCQEYTAENWFGTPGNKQICKACSAWPPCPADKAWNSTDCQDSCVATTPNRMYYSQDYYGVHGVEQMKAELYMWGPLECSIYATDNFDKYTGGIYHEVIDPSKTTNHAIAVVGWGKDEDTQIEYWIGRNSWGTYWGEGGFFKMIMNGNNLNIEKYCTAGKPTFTKPSTTEEEETIIQ